jgi:hypothetical protein
MKKYLLFEKFLKSYLKKYDVITISVDYIKVKKHIGRSSDCFARAPSLIPRDGGFFIKK